MHFFHSSCYPTVRERSNIIITQFWPFADTSKPCLTQLSHISNFFMWFITFLLVLIHKSYILVVISLIGYLQSISLNYHSQRYPPSSPIGEWYDIWALPNKRAAAELVSGPATNILTDTMTGKCLVTISLKTYGILPPVAATVCFGQRPQHSWITGKSICGQRLPKVLVVKGP